MKSSINAKKSLLKSFSIISSMTFLSRITGYIRDAFIAAFLGASFYSDAFFVAFRIPNLFRRLLGEGALTPAIVPVASELLTHKKDSEEELRSIISLSAFIVLIVTVLGIILSPLIVKIFAYGFTKNEMLYNLTVNLNRLMFPYLFLISIVAVYMGFLNSANHFFAPSFSPVLLNLSMIFSLFFLRYFFKLPVYSLAYGVLIGGIAQLLFQIPYLKKENIPYLPNTKLKTEASMAVFKILLPSVFGLAITQINIIVDTMVASFLKIGTVSYLYYADRLLELPIGLFVISFATAILPTISQNILSNDIKAVDRNFSKVIIYSFLFIIPSTFFMFLLGKPTLSILFMRKSFDREALQGTYLALLGYSLGLPFYTFNRIIAPLFYAYKDPRSTVKAGFYAMLTNIFLDFAFMSFGAFGLSAATSVSAFVNSILLYRFFCKKHQQIQLKSIKDFTIKIFFSSSIAAIPTYIISIHFAYGDSLFMSFLNLVVLSGLFIIIIAILLTLLKTEEVKDIWQILKKRLSK